MVNTSPLSAKKIISIVAAIIFAAGLAAYVWQEEAKAPQEKAPASYGNLPAVSSSPEASHSMPATGKTSESHNASYLAASPARILLPSSGDQWLTNRYHLIEWNNETGVSGALALADANTKKILGWILPHTDPGQTSYSWDTRNFYTSRNSQTKGNLLPGKYVIVLQSDKNFAAAESQPVTLVLNSLTETLTYSVRLKDGTVTPKFLPISSGAKVVFINNDSVARRVFFNGIDPIVIGPRGDYLLKSTLLPTAINYFTSDAFQGQAALNIQ